MGGKQLHLLGIREGQCNCAIVEFDQCLRVKQLNVHSTSDHLEWKKMSVSCALKQNF
jgi:hypothetical protein